MLGCSKTDDSAGTLTCKSGIEANAAKVSLAVPSGGLATAKERAESFRLRDCTFAPIDPNARPPVEEVRITPPPPPPPPPPDDDLDPWAVPPQPPQNVPPTLLESNRVAGNKMIVPEDSTALEIKRSGKDRVVGSFKLCLTDDGTVLSVTQLKSTGFADYDTKIKAEMQTWRYLPYLVNGKAVPVCTAITFIYSAP